MERDIGGTSGAVLAAAAAAGGAVADDMVAMIITRAGIDDDNNRCCLWQFISIVLHNAFRVFCDMHLASAPNLNAAFYGRN